MGQMKRQSEDLYEEYASRVKARGNPVMTYDDWMELEEGKCYAWSR